MKRLKYISLVLVYSLLCSCSMNNHAPSDLSSDNSKEDSISGSVPNKDNNTNDISSEKSISESVLNVENNTNYLAPKISDNIKEEEYEYNVISDGISIDDAEYEFVAPDVRNGVMDIEDDELIFSESKITTSDTQTIHNDNSENAPASIDPFVAQTINAKFGDVITMGTYEQDGDPSNGSEPIEWIILKDNGDSFTLLSRYCLEAAPFNETRTFVQWSNCTLRKWLNNVFYNNVFNNDEKKRIVDVTHQEISLNRRTADKEWETTTDKVYLITISELNAVWDILTAPKPVETIDDIIFFNDMSKKLHGQKTDDENSRPEPVIASTIGAWWTRDMQSINEAVVVYGDPVRIAGEVSCTYVDIGTEGIRPMITVLKQ